MEIRLRAAPQRPSQTAPVASSGDRPAGWPIVSYRSPKDWYKLFPNAVVAEGLLDRLINSSFHVHVEGKSYPPRRQRAQTPKLAQGGATK